MEFIIRFTNDNERRFVLFRNFNSIVDVVITKNFQDYVRNGFTWKDFPNLSSDELYFNDIVLNGKGV